MPMSIPPAPSHPGYIGGNYYRTRDASANQNGAVPANYLLLTPIKIEEAVTIDRLMISIQTGSAGLAKAGLFRMLPTGGAQLLVEGNADMDTTTATDVLQGFAANQLLMPGWYYGATCFNATPTMRCNAVAAMNNAFALGGATASRVSGSGNFITGRSMVHTFVGGGASFFPATIAIGSLADGTAANIPHVFLRKAA